MVAQNGQTKFHFFTFFKSHFNGERNEGCSVVFCLEATNPKQNNLWQHRDKNGTTSRRETKNSPFGFACVSVAGFLTLSTRCPQCVILPCTHAADVPLFVLLSHYQPHLHRVSQCGYRACFSSLTQLSHCSTCLLWFSLLSCLFCVPAWLPMCFCLLNFVSGFSTSVSCLQSAFSSWSEAGLKLYPITNRICDQQFVEFVYYIVDFALIYIFVLDSIV